MLAIRVRAGRPRARSRPFAALGLEVLYTKRTRLEKEEEAELGIEWVADKDELIAGRLRLDARQLRARPTTSSWALASSRSMKPTAYFINVGRGRLVDEEAMIAALENGTIAGAGLDVYYSEPPTNVDPLHPRGTSEDGERRVDTAQRGCDVGRSGASDPRDRERAHRGHYRSPKGGEGQLINSDGAVAANRIIDGASRVPASTNDSSMSEGNCDR